VILCRRSIGVYGERQLGWDAAEQDANDTSHKLNVTGRLRQAIINHRASFITEADFTLLASKGINSVRIPVGFWLFQQKQVRVDCAVLNGSVEPCALAKVPVTALM